MENIFKRYDYLDFQQIVSAIWPIIDIWLDNGVKLSKEERAWCDEIADMIEDLYFDEVMEERDAKR